MAVDLYSLSPPAFEDLDVYRKGVQAWWHGKDMYGTLPITIARSYLPFIYPPFALVVLGPLAILPWPAAALTMMVISLVSLTAVVYLTVRHTWPAAGPRVTIGVTAVVVPLSMKLRPVWDTLWFGQVNLLLMLLVVLDCLVVSPRWPRGVLVGIAAAVKLTPAVFVLYFLLRKDYRAAWTAAATGMVGVGIGFLASWSGSLKYWFGSSGGARSIGGSPYFSNQTVYALLARLGPPHHTLLWLAGVAVVLVVAVLAIRGAQGNQPLALCVTGCLGLLASPTSWGHHWVYVVPGLIAMAGQVTSSPRWTVAFLGTAAVFYIAPYEYLPSGDNRELTWTWWQQIPGNSYTITGICLLVALAWRVRWGDHDSLDLSAL
ncbi:MAG TPA: glycosyltransferase 87 family protein [Pseudonocardiaceae bacterium]|nr:glycosyltransferase 87 family protein [Pseudonocardiaceae bacterium]